MCSLWARCFAVGKACIILNSIQKNVLTLPPKEYIILYNSYQPWLHVSINSRALKNNHACFFTPHCAWFWVEPRGVFLGLSGGSYMLVTLSPENLQWNRSHL